MVHEYIASQFTASPSVLAAMERQDMEKLEKVIKEAISSVSSSTGLSESEVMDVFWNVRVQMTSELRSAISSLQQQGVIKQTDPVKLALAMEHAIRMIAEATDLNTDELTDMFTRLKGASWEKFIARIRTKSRMDRMDQE